MSEIKQPSEEPESADARAAYVEAIMRQEAERSASPATPVRRRNRVTILIVLAVVLVGFTAWNVARWPRPPDAATLQRERQATLCESMLYAIDEIESYRDSTGLLPPDLARLGVLDEGLRYRLEGSTYVLDTSEGLPGITYRGGDDIAPLERASAGLWQEIR